MKINETLLTTIVAGALGSAGVAQATPVSMSDTMSLGSLLNNSTTHIHYDASNLLAQYGMDGGNVLSGNLIVYGISDPSYQNSAGAYGAYMNMGSTNRQVYAGVYYYQYFAGYQVTRSWECGYWLSHKTCYEYAPVYQTAAAPYYRSVNDTSYLQQRDINHLDVQDTMTVQAGNTSASASDSVVSHSVGSYGNMTYAGSSGSSDTGYNYYYTQQRDVWDSVSGPIQVSLLLDSLALDALKRTGFIDFDVSAAGQLTFQSVSFSLLGEVPEPSTILLGTGAVAAAVLARRRKRKGAPA